jgi:hypothetical protein
MDATQISFIWGIVALVCGAFMLTYGATLFRFVLAFAGFYIGFTIGMALPVPSATLQVMLALVLGGIAAGVLYSLVAITMYAAGALLGLVAGFVIVSLFGMEGGWLSLVIAVAAGAIGGVFAKSLGTWATILASAAAGAYATVVGLNILFTESVAGAGQGLMPRSAAAIAVFIVFMAVSILAQAQIVDLRNRLRR